MESKGKEDAFRVDIHSFIHLEMSTLYGACGVLRYTGQQYREAS